MAETSLQNTNTFSRLGNSLRTQITSAFAIILALLLIIAGVSYFNQVRSGALVDQLVSVDGQIAKLDLETQVAFAKARGIERSYETQFKELGAEEARNTLFAEWERSMDTVNQNLIQADVLRLQSGADSSSTDEILSQLNLYTVRLTEIVGLIELRGHKDTGQEGELRATIHNFEEIIFGTDELQLQVDMLMLRRHEKDFLLRGEQQYVTRVEDQVAEMKQHIAESQFDSDAQATLVALADEYQSRFGRLANSTFRIDRLSREMGLAVNSAQSELDVITQSTLDDQLASQQALDDSNRIFTIAIIVSTVIALLLGVALVVALMRRFSKQIDSLLNVVSRIREGDYDARVDVYSNDELGTTAIALNEMLDTTTGLIQSEAQRDAIQQSVMSLLDEVSSVAEGDLTIEAEVRDDMTGSIADSFNFMIEQLREIIGNVQEATTEVSSSATEIQTTAEHLAIGSESQATQIVDTSAAIDEMSISIQQVSENAALSATVGQQSRANAQIGAKAVSDTINGMGRIREQVETTAERLERLSASSREIGKITKVINDIAERTSILAINASIQASEAGDAGRGFAVVAEEVERLADRSVLASGQITRLVRTIQEETVEVIRSMESTSDEVARGSMLAQEAGDRLNEIEGVSTKLSDLINSISQAAQQQARGSEAIAKSMNDIADVTQQTAAGTKQATTSIGKLAILADELRSSVSQFKIDNTATDDEQALDELETF